MHTRGFTHVSGDEMGPVSVRLRRAKKAFLSRCCPKLYASDCGGDRAKASRGVSMEDQIASLARDLLGALESQQLELRRVVDVHQDTLDALYGESVLSSWTHSLSPSRRVSAKATNQLQDGDEWQSSVEQDPGLSVMSEMSAEMANAPTVQPVEEPAQAASDSQPSMRPHKSMRASGMAPAASITEMMASSSNTKDMVMLDTAASIIVVLNTLELAFELECEGHSIGTHVGIPDGMQCDDIGPLFVVLNHIFQLAYTVELIFRLWYHRWFFFSSCTNLFDILLVLIGAVDVYVLAVIAERSSSSELMQLLRILKLGRVVRLGRTFHLFPGLRLLMHACTSFLPALGWSMVLLGLCITMGGLTMGTLLQDFIMDESKPMSDRLWVWLHYGTSYRSMYTLYEVTFAGSWPTYARPVLETVSHVYVLFFLLYITFIVFAVIRVISAVFLSQTLEAASSDAEMMIQDRLTKKAKFVQKLEGVFQAMDESGDGLLSEEEMSDLLEDKKVQAYLESLEVAVPESKALFRMLQNSEGQVTYEDFIEGILRCKGPARAMDQIVIQAELRFLKASVEQLAVSLEDAKVIRGAKCRRRHRTPTRTRLADEITLLQAATATRRRN
ncbi:Sodium channel protein type 5 subunit alpha [Symbiodinium microadriaticum]|uniref:Sodium channel protein type 5 subunit alpha n=1 Tax=Symbiodinium microadriaticum TaxID=2951 RepID=A0A1Q9D1Y3_SYMMI|nr:Sodium channel protein type 5 subunit alpha [Symbiodinium microadriaticum]